MAEIQIYKGAVAYCTAGIACSQYASVRHTANQVGASTLFEVRRMEQPGRHIYSVKFQLDLFSSRSI